MQPIAALLEWIEQGRQFRHEEDYAALLGNEFAIDQTGNSQKHFTTWWFFSVTKARACDRLNSARQQHDSC